MKFSHFILKILYKGIYVIPIQYAWVLYVLSICKRRMKVNGIKLNIMLLRNWKTENLIKSKYFQFDLHT